MIEQVEKLSNKQLRSLVSRMKSGELEKVITPQTQVLRQSTPAS
jgi:hypothetical protein